MRAGVSGPMVGGTFQRWTKWRKMLDSTEAAIKRYVSEYLENNAAARLVAAPLEEMGLGVLPLVDHITFRTRDVDARAREFLALGFTEDKDIGVLEFDDWWAKVYRKPGLPAIFIDQAWDGERGHSSVIPRWVAAFGENVLHHVAMNVEDIEAGIASLRARGVEFAGEIVGEPGSDLRQIFTNPEMRAGEPFTVLELAERHRGYPGFSPPQADGLMRSTAKK